ncbi:MAG: acyl-phosphate glycerol 3-phosphate acyltransferase [SAR202 cluster bacterium Io17-Chloro-G9]|nr:MAG: acyl-phosphate glycerol 3-phosphate acyltransferase [SAR202 cluster bacterium Io17-Chloro-G9]
MVRYGVVLALSYLLGSVPWGYLALRWRHGVDIREHGSGSIGMTNVLRTGGGRVAVLVLTLDVAKGILAVVLGRTIIGSTEGEVAASLFALLGHNWPVFLQFRGGRGILTGLGGMSVMAPPVAAIGTVAFIFITGVSRYVSLGSVLGLLITCLAMLLLAIAGMYSPTYVAYTFLGSAIIIWQHRANIQRIREGNEHRLGHSSSRLG